MAGNHGGQSGAANTEPPAAMRAARLPLANGSRTTGGSDVEDATSVAAGRSTARRSALWTTMCTPWGCPEVSVWSRVGDACGQCGDNLPRAPAHLDKRCSPPVGEE